MKCIECNTDRNLKERTANYGKCKNFEPKQLYYQIGFKFTDRFFAERIKNISVNSTLFFSERQFLYLCNLYCQTNSNALRSGLPIFMVIVSLSTSFLFAILEIDSGNPIAASLAVFVSIIFSIFAFQILQSTFTARSKKKLALTSEQIKDLLNKWIAVNGKIEKLLSPPKAEKKLNKINYDLNKYSFNRLIVCEKDEIAQFLIANNFHFENNCAIVSINGYPQKIFETVMQMVKRNRDLKIYAPHDASPDGIKILHTLKTNSDWFADINAVIYDLGLLPRQIFKSKNIFVRQSNSSALLAKKFADTLKDSLSDREIKFINEGKFIELESFTPQKLIQIVTLGIAKSKVSATTDLFERVNIDSNINYGTSVEFDTFG